MLFIAWDQRALFKDTLDACVWESAPGDVYRIVNLWEHIFASRLDPVRKEHEPK